MRRHRSLDVLMRLRELEMERARFERARGVERVREADARVEGQEQRSALVVRETLRTEALGLPGAAWRAARAGLAAVFAETRHARGQLEGAQLEAKQAHERLVEAERRHRALSRLAEKTAAAERRSNRRREQKATDEIGLRGHRARGTLLVAILGVTLPVLALPAAGTAQANALAPSSGAHGAQALLRDIRERQSELDLRELEIEEREQRLQSLEKVVDRRLLEIGEIAEEIESRIGTWEDAQGGKSISKLARIYGSMDAKRAAPLIEALDLELATQIVSKMKPKQSSALLPLLSESRAIAMSRLVAHPLGMAPAQIEEAPR